MITAELIREAIPRAGSNADQFAKYLEAARRKYVGDNWHRVAMFLAQIAHESGSLAYVRELATGEAYEGRKDLGNTQAGDGTRFRGRGLLQVTGRYNYAACGQELGLPLLDQPELLEEPEHAAMSAGWVWKDHGLGRLCQEPDPVLAVTRRLNGGTNGLEDRRERYQVAMTALKLHHSEPMLTQGSTATQPAASPPPAATSPAPIKETIMAAPALILAAAQALLPFISDLMRERGSKTANRNADILEKAPDLVPVIMELGRAVVPGAKNEQEMVETISASKELQAQLRSQAAMRWSEIRPLLEFEEESRKDARDFAQKWDGDRLLFGQLRFVELLSLLFVVIAASGAYLVLTEPTFPAELKGAVVTLILIGGWTSVQQFWLGSSRGSQVKDATISEQAKR